MTQRKLHCINWNTFKQDLIAALNCIQPGETRFWDLPQDFDKELRYAIVLGYDEEGELSIMLGCEDADSDTHSYGVDWQIPVVREERWDTENWISKEDAKKPESIRDRVEYLKNQWDHLQKYLKADMYIPRPADTSNVQLPEELSELKDLLAKNVHDTWAKNRMAQGWRYGLHRNDDSKETPCLVPYEDLTPEEAAYDESTAMETLKAIVSLGYKIVR